MKTAISSDFNKYVKKAIFSIILFAFCFLLMTLVGLGVAFALGYAGYFIIKLKPNFFFLIFGAGLIISGLMVFAFLFKFMFQKSVSTIGDLKEVSRAQHPELFEMIDAIVTTTGTDFPKKVFISSQLNASVFYNSSFWSMFLPVRKNLHIGMGLVNSSTQEELKGILAHEFGHFSQRSMKIGSYVYNVNKIIYNLLYENNSFEGFMAKAGNSHYLIQFTVLIARAVIKGFQKVLEMLYGYLNLRYMALSREMEFHADAVAAQVVGSKIMISSLSRMNMAEKAYNSTLGYVNRQYAEDYKILNFFKLNAFVLSYYGKLNKMEFTGRFPVVSSDELNKYSKSRLNVEDQWASHPTIEERIAKIETLNIPGAEENAKEGFEFFRNVEVLQRKMTEELYPSDDKDEIMRRSEEEDETAFLTYYDSLTFNREYNGYYDSRNPLVRVPDLVSVSETVQLDSLYSDAVLARLSQLHANVHDVEQLQFIATGQHSVKTFDFEGKKYFTKQAVELLPGLEEEKKMLEASFEKHDVLVYSFFTKQALDSGCTDHFQLLYKQYRKTDSLFERGSELVNELNEKMLFLNAETPNIQIERNLKELEKKEEEWKSHLNDLMELSFYTEITETTYHENLKKYCENREAYFFADAYNIPALNLLIEALNCSYQVHADLFFQAKKQLLDFQIRMVRNKAAQ